MTKSFKPILTELLWLAIAFIVTLLIYSLGFYWDFSSVLHVYRSDTYLVFTATAIMVPLFLMVTFVLYFIKEIRKKFKRALPNIIMLTTGLLLIILLTLLTKNLAN